MSRIEFIVPGVPQPSRVQRIHPWQESVQWCWQAQTGRARVSGSALLFADFFLPRPKHMNTAKYPEGLVEHTTISHSYYNDGAAKRCSIRWENGTRKSSSKYCRRD